MSSSSHSSKLALVTGLTGFVGSHLVQQLLDKGYKVRGTVRDKSNTAKLAFVKKLPHQERLEIVEADLTNAPSLHAAVKGCQLVFHVASPFPSVPPADENLIIKPAVEGTLEILKACAENPTVEHLVITSSIVAIFSLTGKKGSDHVFNEEDWADLEGNTAYNKSKVMAEKAAWEFYHNLRKEKGKAGFRMTVINPGGILGPSLGGGDFTSADRIRQLLTGGYKFLMKTSFSLVDVRDVARAHILAVEKPEASDGKRYVCCCGEALWFDEIAEIIRKEYGKYGYPIPSVVPDKCPIPDPKHPLAIYWGKCCKMDNSLIKKDLGIEFVPAKESVLEMAKSLIENGAVPNLITKAAEAKK